MEDTINCEDILVFKKTFSSLIWKNEDKISFLKSNILSIEENVKSYLHNISVIFPLLTDHSIKHSRMLWNYANLIIGDQEKFLNPLEGFILHTVFLIHDAGMCYSILDNKEEIENDPIYFDYISLHGNNDKSNSEALFYTTRQRHGDFALRAATERLKEGEYLINNTKLREELGDIIGKIAKSHTCEINFIEREFGERYSPPSFPTDWGIDCQKIALLLRTCDAAHIDNLRTPKTNRMIKEIEGVSGNHWSFQKKLGFPTLLDDGYLSYNTNSPFKENEQKAWWFCYEALLVLDKELKKANEYFVDKGQQVLLAKGVKSINDTLNLGKNHIRTLNWNSIDTKIKVNNPVHIAQEMGGEKLYGHSNLALRELIQNSLDAINLYRIYSGQENLEVGSIKILLEKKESDFILKVIDNGIGMSKFLMTEELLDFGGSYWKSRKFFNDFEGVRAKGFDAIGKFGIGFFSSFMLGNEITVTSWKYGTSIDEMSTLDFYDGLNSTPLLRKPTKDEKQSIIDRGTSLKIKLHSDPYAKDGFMNKPGSKYRSLYDLIKYLVPSPNVNITIKDINGVETSIIPNKLESIGFPEIIDYLENPQSDVPIKTINQGLKSLPIELTDINHGKVLLGKLALGLNLVAFGDSHSVVISKGIRINTLPGLFGYIFTDDVITIRRDKFKPKIPFESLKSWAIKQKKIIEERDLMKHYKSQYYHLLISFSLYDENVPILMSKRENKYSYVSIKELRIFLRSNSSVKIHTEGFSIASRPKTCDGFLFMNVTTRFEEIVNEESSHKVQNYDDLLESTIRDMWGKFDKKDFNPPNYAILNQPYMKIVEFSKKK
ncbi:HD domain-containing protein [Costertonia aggregata]|uniref:ATP-binding protein n=1 Tax=Costertonia aggregata TaxID=343403 RepID=A0A7H9AMB3_9FLAO|nr:ATP-binding protein [Costertonia aggregata]QLG44588.1 ATP-binding protein [Costertonia aggregata]